MALSRREILERIAEMKELQALQKEINEDLGGYLNGLNKLKKINEDIKDNTELQAKIQAKMSSMANGPAKDAEQQKLNYLIQQTNELENQAKILGENLKTVNKTKLLMGEAVKGLVKGFASFPDMIEKGYGKIKSLGLFEMDKAIKQSSLSMGLLSTQSNAFRSDIMAASRDTLEIGVGVEQLAKMQAEYSEELGRTVMLNKEGLKAISEIAVTTGLGAEGAAKMAADFEKQGLSAERMAEFVNQTMTDSSKMGLNATKVVKNIQSNIKMLNKYNFKGGIKGLKEMAQTVAKLGVDMNFATGMADKLFDIEGAVDMSAQLQVMGGAWAKLADPFHLMYMARNDMAGLTEELGKAAESSVDFNKGQFEISALEMHRLRKIAEQTGVAYEDLAEAGKNARKQTEIRKQMRFNIDEETKEFLANTAKFTEKGDAYIEVKGEKKMLKSLSEADRTFLKNQLAEKKNLEERAKEARTFDEALVNLINQFKVSLMPLIDVMNERLIPKIDSFVERIKDEGWLDKLSEFAKTIGGMISFFGGFVLEYPKVAATIYGAMKLTGFFMEKANWIANGLALAKGFNMGTGGGDGGGGMGDFISGKLGQTKGGGFMKNFKGAGASKLLKLGGVATALFEAYSEYSDSQSRGESGGESLGRGLTKGGLAGLGGWGGAAAGAALGTAIFPGIGTAIGGLIGGAIGAFGGSELGGGIGDAIYGEPTNDGYFAGKGKSNFSNNRAIMQGGKITPIDNKDDLMALKKDGIVDKTMKNESINQPVKHEFGDIKITGELVLSTPGGERVSTEILKDPQLIRTLTRMIHVETEKVINGGKPK
jgi:hypothetical protein